MNYLLLSLIAINLLFSIYAMDTPEQPSFIQVITTDKHIIEVDEVIAQQSDWLKALQGFVPRPIRVPVDKKDLDFLCSYITTPTEQLNAQLSREDYSQLMDTAEKLQCLVFYAQLLEQLISNDDLINKITREQIKTAKFKKTVYTNFTEKKCIKKSRLNEEKFSYLEFSRDGNYFLENVSDKSIPQINLWNSKTLCLVRSFDGYLNAKFSPSNDYVLFYNNRKPSNPCIYFIKDNTITNLIDNDPNVQFYYYTSEISYDGKYIIHKFSPNTFLLQQINDNLAIQPMPDVTGIAFHPSNKHIIYIKNQELAICELENQNNKQIIDANLELKYWDLSISPNGAFLLLTNYRKPIKWFNCKNPQKITLIKQIDLSDYSTRLFIPQKNILACNPDPSTPLLFDETGNQLASYTSEKNIHILTTNRTGDRFAACSTDSTILLSDLSNIENHILGKIMKDPNFIKKMSFIHSGLLLTLSVKTKLWDMHGNEVFSLGKNNQYACSPSRDSIITTQDTDLLLWSNDNQSYCTIKGSTKLLHWTFDTEKSEKTLQSLIPSQTLLLNAHHIHRKDKKPTLLYPNMPDGRALASLQKTFATDKEYKFLAKNFKLAKRNFIPKTPPTSQLKKHLLEQS